MSIYDILRGDKPLVRKTLSSRVREIEADYARMASAPSNFGSLSPRISKDYNRQQCETTYAAIEPDEGTLHADAYDALMQDREAAAANYIQWITIRWTGIAFDVHISDFRV